MDIASGDRRRPGAVHQRIINETISDILRDTRKRQRTRADGQKANKVVVTFKKGDIVRLVDARGWEEYQVKSVDARGQVHLSGRDKTYHPDALELVEPAKQ